jgi:L-alanine-DL-glutamate epimerase-like enolase superfamily enzyme
MAGHVALDGRHPMIAGAVETAKRLPAPVHVTDIEVHEITVPYRDWIAGPLNHYYGPTRRTVYVAHTDNGLTGLGESGGPESPDVIEQYIGTNPFDWVGDETSLGLGTAMYDLMGKAAGVPVYKLFGQRYRRLVPVGCWTVSTNPGHMAQTVKQYAADGYTWLKYHLSPFENVIDQLTAMQKVAPKGFRVMFDLTMGGTTDHIPELLERMAEFPIAGAFEDPLNERNIEGYIELRKRSPLPILLHHAPLGHTFEVLRRAADAYIVGHAKIGSAIRAAGLFAAANAPFMLQNVGGMITRAMTTHMQAAFKTATHPFHSDAETWSDDVVNERLEPVNGLLRVPETPGLGVTINREALDRLKHLTLPEQDRWIIRTRYANGTTMYNIADPKNSIFMVRPDHRRLAPMSYSAPLSTDYWDNDGTEQYRMMFAQIEKDGIVLVRD